MDMLQLQDGTHEHFSGIKALHEPFLSFGPKEGLGTKVVQTIYQNTSFAGLCNVTILFAKIWNEVAIDFVFLCVCVCFREYQKTSITGGTAKLKNIYINRQLNL